eukprot:GFUD01043199.1.p1 GENE.GFUD01043199.1~~GFUD01043199.1.p1  ORF type:complete len:563 (-),score=118.93 GFUD01043199.1:254-1942(-)
MEVNERLLLPEIWMEVLKFLPVKDLCNMSLVSLEINDLCSRPKLWTSTNIKKIKFRNGDVRQYFKIDRFRRVKRLDFSRIPLTLENVQQILEHSILSDLCEIDLQGINLSEIAPELLSKSLQPLRKVDLTFTKLTSDHSEHLFSYLENNQPTKMKEISFKAINLSTINPMIFASTIARMEKVNLSFTELTTDQLTALFDKLVTQHDVNLNAIEFFSVDLSGTSPRLLGQALGCLECVNFSNTELRFEHIQSIFEEIMRSKRLKEVNLDFSELFYISNNLFAKSLIQLEKVSLACTVMDVEQLETLFELISKESKIKELDLLDTDLTGIGAELMGSAVNKLEKANLSGSKLNGEQLNPMVQQFDFKVLKDINLDYLDLSKVSIENICNLLKHLENISLKKSSLTTEQINAFLAVLAFHENVKLKNLNLHGNNLHEVSSAELQEAVTNLVSIDLSNTNIPLEVITKVFEAISNAKFTTLRNLVLVGNSLDTLDPEVIAQAMSKLEKLDLSNSGLSPDQVNELISAVAYPVKELSLFNIKMENVDQNILERAKDVAFINYRYQNH